MASDDITVDVRGLKEANRALYRFSQQLGDRVVLKALREGAKIIQKTARSYAPKRSGALKKSIKVRNSKKYSKRRTPDKLGVYITVDEFYGRLIEDGWNARGRNPPNGGRFSRNRKTLPSQTDVVGAKYMDRAVRSAGASAVRQTQQSVIQGARIVARKTGVKFDG